VIGFFLLQHSPFLLPTTRPIMPPLFSTFPFFLAVCLSFFSASYPLIVPCCSFRHICAFTITFLSLFAFCFKVVLLVILFRHFFVSDIQPEHLALLYLSTLVHFPQTSKRKEYTRLSFPPAVSVCPVQRRLTLIDIFTNALPFSPVSPTLLYPLNQRPQHFFLFWFFFLS